MKSPQMSSKSGGGKAHCVVCGDESSGFHYGVDSCEGCKGFFRRCITQGMNHKCANEEKCEITPFTRNSCQYCRLKKCFEVGMSREASRLGRRPKRLKEVGGEGSGGSRVGNLPIAPYPAPQDMNRMRMEQLQKILQSSGSLKEDLMQAFVSVAKASFQEHSKTGEKGKGCENQPEQKPVVTECTPMDVLASVSSVVASSSSASVESRSASVDSMVQGGMDADSPSSLNSPGGSSCIRDLNLTAFENFLFEQGMPSTPGSAQQILLDSIGDLQALNSPYNPGSVGGLDYVSAATSPVSDLGLGSPLVLPSSSSVTNDGVGLVNDLPNTAGTLTLNTLTLNSPNMCAPAPQVCSQTQQQQQQQQLFLQTPMPTPQNNNTAPNAAGATDIRGEVKTEIMTEIKTEPNGNFSSSCMVKKEPVSPKTRPSRLASFAINDESKYVIDVKSIMDEVRQTPTETRRQLIEQVTDAVVDAHVHTTINTHKSIEEANQRIEKDLQKQSGNEESNLLKVRADYLWRQFVSAMVPEITKVVKFSKKLPGFQEIEQDDQIRLIKQGAFEVMMCRFAMLVDAVNQTVLDPKLTTRCPREVIQATPMGEFLDEFFYVATRFNPLRLTDGEVGLFTSVLIVCPSRKGLKNKIAIGKIQTLFQQALYILMKHNHPDAEERFERLMGLIGIFRRINDEHFKAINEIRLSLPPETSFPALHEEIFDNSY